MHIPVMSHSALMGEFVAGEFGTPRDFEDESEVEQTLCVSGEGSEEAGGEGGVSSRGNGGAIRDRPAAVKVIPCPRCQSMNTKFCYYNNYSVNQPRHFCRNCQRYWTVGGTLRNVPVGGGSRKKTRTRSRNDGYLARDAPPASSSSDMPGLLSESLCMQQLAMLPSTLGGIGIPGLGMASFPNPFLAGFAHSGTPNLFPAMPPPKSSPISGIQEVPELQTFYDVPAANSAPMMVPNTGFFLPDLQSGSDALASVMAKASLWSSPAQQLQALTGGRAPSSSAWEDRPLVGKANSLTSQQLSHLSGYVTPTGLDPIGATGMNSKLAPLHDGFWETALMHSRPVMNDRLVPHVSSNSWEEPNFSPNSTNFSPNSSTTEERCPPSNCFGYHEDAPSQPWVGLQGSDILQF